MLTLNRVMLCLIAMMALTLTACQTTSQNVKNGVNLYAIGDYTAAATTLKPETEKKDEDFVLNNCRYGSAALAAGQLENAETAFLSAYEVINGVNTNSGGRTLGATMVFEGVKVWKGEPFERAMAHYYLGLLYLMKNDYENARAAFRNSLFKLREYAKDKKGAPEQDQYHQFESNFALGYFGLGYCYLRTGQADLANQNFGLAIKLQPGLKPVIDQLNDPKVNTLIFIDYGKGPVRAGKGWYNEESAFGPTPAEAGPIPTPVVAIDGKGITLPIRYQLTDTLAMAQEQKWQDIDTIRKAKAVIGTGAMAAGTGVAVYGAQKGDAGTALVGLGIALAGAALAASSQADIRYWETLPRTVYVIPAALDPGEHTIEINVNGSTTSPFKVSPKAPGQGDNILYIRLR